MKELALAKVYQLLEPGPVVLLTTARRGQANVMTMSWHMMIEFEPPQVACVVSNANYSFAALKSAGECVIAIPGRKLATKVVRVGNTSGRDVDKFAAFGLTKMPASHVGPPLIAECFANLECRVTELDVGEEIQPLHSPSDQSLDRSGAKETQDNSPSRLRHVRRRR